MVTSDTGLTVPQRDRPSRRFKSCPRHQRTTRKHEFIVASSIVDPFAHPEGSGEWLTNLIVRPGWSRNHAFADLSARKGFRPTSIHWLRPVPARTSFGRGSIS